MTLLMSTVRRTIYIPAEGKGFPNRTVHPISLDMVWLTVLLKLFTRLPPENTSSLTSNGEFTGTHKPLPILNSRLSSQMCRGGGGKNNEGYDGARSGSKGHIRTVA